MSGAALTAHPGRTSLLRLGRVESRKMLDTRAGLSLVLLTLLSAVAAVVVDVATGSAGSTSLGGSFSNAMLASGVLLPVVAILLMTSEWSQRTALSTFALVPVRERVIAAKLLAVLALLAATTVICLVLSALGTAIDGGDLAITLDDLGRTVIHLLLVLMFGFALAAILMSSPAAIVFNFVTPTIIAAAGAISERFNDAVAWIDPGAFGALTDATTSGGEWQRIATAALAWIGIPIALGLVRLRRRDIS